MGPLIQVALVIGLLLVWVAVIYRLEKTNLKADRRRQERAKCKAGDSATI